MTFCEKPSVPGQTSGRGLHRGPEHPRISGINGNPAEVNKQKMATKKRRSRGVNHKNGVSVLPEGVEQREKHGGNEGFPSGGAPGDIALFKLLNDFREQTIREQTPQHVAVGLCQFRILPTG